MPESPTPSLDGIEPKLEIHKPKKQKANKQSENT
jgi:hypothetical protein